MSAINVVVGRDLLSILRLLLRDLLLLGHLLLRCLLLDRLHSSVLDLRSSRGDVPIGGGREACLRSLDKRLGLASPVGERGSLGRQGAAAARHVARVR